MNIWNGTTSTRTGSTSSPDLADVSRCPMFHRIVSFVEHQSLRGSALTSQNGRSPISNCRMFTKLIIITLNMLHDMSVSLDYYIITFIKIVFTKYS